jgi:hypothetical protein
MSTCATSSFTDCSPRSRSSTICKLVASAKAVRAVDCTNVYILVAHFKAQSKDPHSQPVRPLGVNSASVDF